MAATAADKGGGVGRGKRRGKAGQAVKTEQRAAVEEQVQHLVERGELRKAVAQVEAHVKSTGAPAGAVVSYNRLLRECARKGEVQCALRFDACLHPDEISLQTHTLLLSVCARAADVPSAERVATLMRERGFHLDCPAYTTLILAYSKAGRISDAFSTFERMVELDCVPPNHFTYTTLLEGLSRSIRLASESSPSQPEHVHRLISWCESLWASMRSLNIEPDTTALVCFISSYARAARIHPPFLERAFAWDALLPKDERPQHSLSLLLHGCVSASEPERALCGFYSERALSESRRECLLPHAVSAALSACVQLSRPGEALSILRQGGHDDPKLVAIALDACEDAESAERTRAALGSEGFAAASSADAFGEVLSALAWEGNVQGALGMLEESKGIAGSVSTSAINTMLSVRGEDCGAPVLGEAAREELEKCTAQPNRMTWLLLVDSACHENDIISAMERFEEAISAGVEPQAVASPRLLTLLARQGKKDELDRVMEALCLAGMEGSNTLWNARLAYAVAVDDYSEVEDALMRPSSDHDAVGRLILMGGLAKQQRGQDLLQKTREAINAGDQLGPSHGNMAAYAIALLATESGLSPDQRAERRGIAEELFDTMCKHCGNAMDLDTLDKFMCCFRRPGAFGVLGHPDHSQMDEPELACFYFPQALAMYERAQQYGIVPQFQVTGGNFIQIDTRRIASSLADVSILTLFNSLRRRKAIRGEPSPRIEIQTLNRWQQQRFAKASRKKRASKERRQLLTGARVGDLLKRLQVSYTAESAKGLYTITGPEVDAFLAGRPSFSPLSQRRRGPDPWSIATGGRNGSELENARSQIRMRSYDIEDSEN
jgi:pentatricopeptide repeat protein